MGQDSGRQCIFCPHKADSKEHVWSQWILDLLPEGKKGVFTQRLADGTERTWPTSKPDLRVRVVCERRCNNGWMSTKLEAPMRAATENIIIHNNRKIFDKAECDTIAAWAFKSAVIANHMKPDREPFFSVYQRRAFAHDLTIPKGVQVWIAQRNAGYLTARYMTMFYTLQGQQPMAPHLRNLPVSPYRFEIYVCVLSVGYLLLQVTAARWTERKIANFLDFPTIAQDERFNDYAIPIWPTVGNFRVHWPPRLSVGNDLFETFCQRFAKFNLPFWMR